MLYVGWGQELALISPPFRPLGTKREDDVAFWETDIGPSDPELLPYPNLRFNRCLQCSKSLIMLVLHLVAFLAQVRCVLQFVYFLL